MMMLEACPCSAVNLEANAKGTKGLTALISALECQGLLPSCTRCFVQGLASSLDPALSLDAERKADSRLCDNIHAAQQKGNSQGCRQCEQLVACMNCS